MNKSCSRFFISAFIILVPFVTNVFSQSDSTYLKKHSIGIQFNPYIKRFYLGRNKLAIVCALRYGYVLNNYFRIGPEVSMRLAHVPNELKAKIFTAGIYSRFSLFKKSKVKPLLEASAYFFYRNSLSYYNGILFQHRIDKELDYYLAPGVSFFFNKRLSLDLLFKWKHEERRETNIGPFNFSYRLNFHFSKFR